MKCSELILMLAKNIEQHGDTEVRVFDFDNQLFHETFTVTGPHSNSLDSHEPNTEPFATIHRCGDSTALSGGCSAYS